MPHYKLAQGEFIGFREMNKMPPSYQRFQLWNNNLQARWTVNWANLQSTVDNESIFSGISSPEESIKRRKLYPTKISKFHFHYPLLLITGMSFRRDSSASFLSFPRRRRRHPLTGRGRRTLISKPVNRIGEKDRLWRAFLFFPPLCTYVTLCMLAGKKCTTSVSLLWNIFPPPHLSPRGARVIKSLNKFPCTRSRGPVFREILHRRRRRRDLFDLCPPCDGHRIIARRPARK